MNNKDISLRKIFLLIVIFSILIFGFKLMWSISSENIKTLHINKGKLNLTEEDYENHNLFHLDGEWEFYPNVLLKPSEINHYDKQHTKVPSTWNKLLDNSRNDQAKGIGTYRLNINIPVDKNDYSLYFINIHSAAKVYVNNKVQKKMGTIAETANGYIGKAQQLIVPFHAEGDHVELVVQVANHDLPKYGGIVNSVIFGDSEKVNLYKTTFDVLQIVLISLYVLHGIYGVILLLFGRRKREVIFYVLITFASTIAALFDGQQFGVFLFQTSLITTIKLKIIAYTSISLFILLTVKYLNIKAFANKGSRYLLSIHAILITLTVFFPMNFLIYVMGISSILSIITFIYITYINIINKYYSKKYYHILIFLNVCLVSGVISNIIFNYSNLNLSFFPIETIFVFMGLVVLLYKKSMVEISEYESLSERLQDMIDLKDLLTESIVNKLQSPLQIIENMAHIVNHHDENSEKNKERLRLITSNSEHLRIVINNLFSITKLQDKQITLNKEKISIYDITNSLIPIYQLQHDKEVKIINHVAQDFPYIYADYSKMMQVMSILIQNSIQYTEKGSINISSVVKNKQASIVIQDTGVGIDESIIEYIFNPYMSDSRRAGKTNVGLDLYICKQLIELHDGSIHIDTKNDLGSTYTFSIPLYNENHQKKKIYKVKSNDTINESKLFVRRDKRLYSQLYKPDQALVKSLYGSKILIIDSDRCNAENIAQSLNDNYEVSVEKSTIGILEKIEKEKYDLVLSEVLMPKKSGLMLTKKIREKYTAFELPIILFSSSNYNDEKYSSFIVGANEFMSKPMDVLELKTRVFSLLALKKSIKDHLQIEAAWLQAQIRPHFLYNTLSTIISYSYIDTEEMLKLLENFSVYLRKSFSESNMHNLIPLYEEYELIYAYLEIQKARFKDRLNVMIHSDDIEDLWVPPLAIQTLVENAVRHGVLKKSEGGTIYISLKRYEEYALLSIKDDGVGMTDKDIKNILSPLKKDKYGVGVYNANTRLIRLLNTSIHIESEKNIGTIIRIILPYQA